MKSENTSKHVVIVGGGFAGIACARELAKHSNVRITLLDKNNYHQFQPLLYQVATAQLAPSDVSYALRKIFSGAKNVDVKLTEVAAIDPTAKTVTTAAGEVYRGDYLVLAVGAQANFFNTPGADRHTVPMYCLEDALRLRFRILQVFEDADRDPKLLDEGALNFVIVGAGATGVETAGALAELIRDTMTHEYKDLDVSAARIYLVEHGHTVLAPFSDKAHSYAEKVLQDIGVQLRLGTGVKEVASGHVLLTDGSTIKTRVVVWAGGLMAAPLAGKTGLPQGHGGRINVQPDLTVTGFPGIYALGDLANTPDAAGKALPQLGSVAQQAGEWAAQNIVADIAGKPRTAFVYHDKGIMAMITRTAAVAEMGENRHELHGMLAATAWRGVHVSLMSGIRNKVEAFVKWTWAHFSQDRGPQALYQAGAGRINWEDDMPDVEAVASQIRSTDLPMILASGGPVSGSGQVTHSALDLPESLARQYDVIIIGTGAGGGTLVRHLAASGKRILLLERGDFLPREKENWNAAAVFVKNRYVSPDTWYDADGRAFQPGVHYFVGGATKMYGAALFRLRKEDFKEVRHHDGMSPAWPISYEDLEPYYTQAEKLYFVHGLRGPHRAARQ
jgi:NADH dehydrogenase